MGSFSICIKLPSPLPQYFQAPPKFSPECPKPPWAALGPIFYESHCFTIQNGNFLWHAIALQNKSATLYENNDFVLNEIYGLVQKAQESSVLTCFERNTIIDRQFWELQNWMLIFRGVFEGHAHQVPYCRQNGSNIMETRLWKLLKKAKTKSHHKY